MKNETICKQNSELFKELGTYKKGTAAYTECRNRIVQLNYHLIQAYLNSHRNKLCFGLCERSDYVQECFLALIKAVEKYDPNNEQGAEFSTYAYYWLMQAVGSCTAKNRIINIPVQTVRESYQKNISDFIPQKKRDFYQTVQNMLDIESLDEQYEDMDYLFDTEVDYRLNPHLNEDALTDNMAVNRVMSAQINGMLDTILTEREKNIVIKYYYEEKTMEQTGKELGITMCRVSQLLHKAIRKLRRECYRTGVRHTEF